MELDVLGDGWATRQGMVDMHGMIGMVGNVDIIGNWHRRSVMSWVSNRARLAWLAMLAWLARQGMIDWHGLAIGMG